MGKHHILPALALAGGLAGFGLRLWQRTSALDPATELFASGAPASLALWGLMAALALAALLLSRGGAQPEHAFLCPSAGYMTLMTAAGMCFLLAAALGVPELMEQIQTWQVDPVHHIMPAGDCGRLSRRGGGGPGFRAEQLPGGHWAADPDTGCPPCLRRPSLADGGLSDLLP